MIRGGWWATAHVVANSQTGLSNTFTFHKKYNSKFIILLFQGSLKACFYAFCLVCTESLYKKFCKYFPRLCFNN